MIKKVKNLRFSPLVPIDADMDDMTNEEAKMYIIYTDLLETVNKILDLCVYWESFPPWGNKNNKQRQKLK